MRFRKYLETGPIGDVLTVSFNLAILVVAKAPRLYVEETLLCGDRDPSVGAERTLSQGK